MDFIYCSTCQGQGKIEEKICSECQGVGLYKWVGGWLCFWRKEIWPAEIFLEKFNKVFWILINIFLFIFGVLGIISLFGVIFHLEKLVLGSFLLGQKFFLFIFWFSLFSDCYLYYRLERYRGEKIKIWPKTERRAEKKSLDWSVIKKISNSLKINVCEALSNTSKQVVLSAWATAKKLKHQEILPVHLFIASLSNRDIILVFNRLGVDWSGLKDKISQIIATIPSFEKSRYYSFSKTTKEILINAYEEATKKRLKQVTPLNILETIVASSGPIKDSLYDLEIGLEEIKNVCLWIEVYNEIKAGWRQFAHRARFKPKGAINRAMTAVITPNLDLYSHDLTQIARVGYLSPCMDREKELSEIFRIIESGRQSVILVGPPGVGKTSIINGIARAMVLEDVPQILKDKRLVSLSLPSLVAGASQPGEVEARLQIILNEIIRAGNVILYIPNIHNMVDVRTTEGELDISEILAEVLKKQAVLILATSNPIDYRRYLETRALGEVLQKIEIVEPGQNEMIQILEANMASIEAKEHVYFSYQALVRAIELSRRYFQERYLPEKAITLLKEVAIHVKNQKRSDAVVLAEDVAGLVAEKTSIPLTKITAKESERLLNLEEIMHQRIVDQDEAVRAVATAIRRARTELRDVKKPIVNLLFLGPTGVGKTELAKTVADVYFGDENRMVRLDMSEYQDQTSIHRLIGLPGGTEGGFLTEQIRLNPFSILLLDEIEKAHPDILNIFLQVMDDGRLTDALGRTIDFTNVILIGTSNAGTDYIQEALNQKLSIEKIQEILVREKLKPYFRPEFLNRFDAIIVFKPLGREEVKKIAKLLLAKLAKQLEAKGVALRASEEAIEELALAGFDPAFGARPLKRVIQERVNNALANFLLTGQLGRRDIAVLEKRGVIRVEKKEGAV